MPPLLLDNSMPVDLNHVDDLFGDGVQLQIPVRPHGQHIINRLDELRTRGCCQTVAWSKSGTIASLSLDGQNLSFRSLKCHPDTDLWDLGKPAVCDIVKGTPSIPLVHLEWSTTSNSELAILDAAGRVIIVSLPSSLNNAFFTRVWDSDGVDDFNAIAGCYWLPTAPMNHQKSVNLVYGPARKQGNGYSYESSFVHALGPSHPQSTKSALLCVTVSGSLKMYWAQSNNRMEETVVELESVNTLEELVTHAAFSPDKKHLLVAIATSHQLRLLKIDIQWVGPGSSSEKSAMPPHARLAPALVETHLASADWLDRGASVANGDTFIGGLSSLHIMPTVIDPASSSTVPPMLLAVRSIAAGESGFQTSRTILDRWEVVETRQVLDPAFEQLRNRSNSTSSEMGISTKLKRLESIIIEKVVIGLQIIQFGKAFVLTMSDGSVEYRDRITFEELWNNQDVEKVMVLRQAGWSFPENGSCQQAVFSPTQCSMILVGDDGEVKWNKMHCAIETIGDSVQDPFYSATIAGATIACASAIWHQSNFDDILAVVQPVASKKRFFQDWISDLIRILKIQVDYSEEAHQETLMRNTPLQFCLSIMKSLPSRDDGGQRSFQSKFAMLGLNLRHVMIVTTVACNAPVHIRDTINPLDEREIVEAMAGCAQWSVDLLSWLVESLFELMNDEEFKKRTAPNRFGDLNAYLHKKNNIALHLILSSSTRCFLSVVARRVAQLENISNQAMDAFRIQESGAVSSSAKTASHELKSGYRRMQKTVATSLVKALEFEKLMNGLSQDIRQSYATVLPQLIKKQPNALQSNNPDVAVKTVQTQCELAMLLCSSPLPAFLHVIRKFFAKDLPAFRRHTDPAKLFFANYDLLEMQDDVGKVSWPSSTTYVDLFKKVKLRRQDGRSRWRQCTRCSAVMEDVQGGRPGYNFVIGHLRKCSCGGSWALLPREEMVL